MEGFEKNKKSKAEILTERQIEEEERFSGVINEAKRMNRIMNLITALVITGVIGSAYIKNATPEGKEGIFSAEAILVEKENEDPTFNVGANGQVQVLDGGGYKVTFLVGGEKVEKYVHKGDFDQLEIGEKIPVEYKIRGLGGAEHIVVTKFSKDFKPIN